MQEISQSKAPVFISSGESTAARPCSDESELICRHYDHCLNRTVKGVNFLTALFQTGNMRLPCAAAFVRKGKWVRDEKTGKQKRVAAQTKNGLFRQMAKECSERFRFDYVLSDSWYAPAENRKLVKSLNMHFIMVLKSNRKIALSPAAKEAKEYASIESLQPGAPNRGGGLAERAGFSAVAGKAGLQRRG